MTTNIGVYRAITPHFGWVSGNYYNLAITAQGITAVTAINILYLFPVVIYEPLPLRSLGLRVLTTAGVNSTAKIGMWRAARGNTATGLPVAASNTPIATTSLSYIETPDLNVIVPPGRYFAGSVHTHTAGSLPAVSAVGSSHTWIDHLVGSSTNLSVQGSGNACTGYSTPFVHDNDITALNLTGATLTRLQSGHGVPNIGVRVS